MYTTNTLSRKRQSTQLAILHAASQVFKEQNYGRTSMEMIAQTAQISRSTMYTFYKSKEEIVEDIFATIIKQLENYKNKGPYSGELFSTLLFEQLKSLPFEVGFISQMNFHPQFEILKNLLVDIFELKKEISFKNWEAKAYFELNKELLSVVFWDITQICMHQNAGSYYFGQYLRGLLYNKI